MFAPNFEALSFELKLMHEFDNTALFKDYKARTLINGWKKLCKMGEFTDKEKEFFTALVVEFVDNQTPRLSGLLG